MRYQCINSSHFKLEQKNNNAIARFTSKDCITMMMNTFLKLESEVIIIINPHDGADDGRYNLYSGIQNFYENKYSNIIIRFDMQASTSATLDQCIFSNIVQNGEKITNTNSDGKATVFISNCVFKTYLNKDNLHTFSSSNCFEYIDTNS